MHIRRILINSGLLVSSLVVALLAGEFGLRALQWAGVVSSDESVVFPTVRYFGKQRVSQNKLLIFEHDTNDPLINRDGFRDRDYPVAHSQATRIMALGDSVTFGRGVPSEETYARVLEARLNEKNAGTHEVMNFAVGGYNSEQEFEFYRTVGRKYQPDLLIIGFVLNDCHPASVLMNHFAAQKANKQKMSRQEASEPDGLLGQSRLFERLRGWLDETRKERPGTPLWVSKQCAIPENWAIVERGFRELADITAADATPVVVVIFPMLYDFDNYPFAALHESVQAEARKHGFPVLDLFRAFAEFDADELQAAPGDLVHLSAKGHRVAARSIHRFLLENEIARVE